MEWVPDALSALEENSCGKTHEAPWAVMTPHDPDIKQAIEIPRGCVAGGGADRRKGK